MSDERAERPIRRRVFYIPGFDPYPPRRYRELYRKQGAEQARISGYRLALRARIGAPLYSWDVAARMDDRRIQSRYEVLVWHDLVKTAMDTSIAGTYLQLLRTAWLYVTSRALWRLSLLRKGPVIAALYPIFALLGQLLAAFLAGYLVTRVISGLTWPGVGLIAGLPLFVFLMQWFRRQDHRWFAYYLMHDYAFTASRKGANPPLLETRMEEFRTRIRAALASDVHEVLVVGHSSGAQLAVSILADLDRAGDIPEGSPALGLLTLGQVLPMVSFLPKAMRLRRDLQDLSLSRSIFWLDVSAPGDGCSFALCDPVAVSGVAPKAQRWPLVISAAFSQTLSPAKWNSLKRQYFRLHFQYLCAFDRPGDYDYFRITAGPLTLAERFAGRAPSKSRIDVPASPHVSLGR